MTDEQFAELADSIDPHAACPTLPGTLVKLATLHRRYRQPHVCDEGTR